MKKIITILSGFLICIIAGSAQTVLFSESFETDGEGVRYFSNTYNEPTPNCNFFYRTSAAPLDPCFQNNFFTNFQGNFFWGSEDIMRTGAPLPPGSIITQTINVAGYSGLTVSLYLATSNNVLPTNFRWESADSINIKVSLDNGVTYSTVGRFMGSLVAGGDLVRDLNLNGIVDGAEASSIVSLNTFTKYTFSVPGTGSNMRVWLDFDQTGGSEELGIDLIQVEGNFTGGPEINVLGNGANILDGDVTPSTSDHTDFGSLGVCSGTLDRTFTIQNTGTTNLTISGTTITGVASGDYSIITPPTSPVLPSGNSTMVVRFTPSATGARNASITINSNDADEAAYDFSITGNGIDPEINIQGNGSSITDGDAIPTLTDHTDFGNQSVCSGSVVRTFTIQNTGSSNLTIGAGAITLTGVHASDYSIGGITLPATIAASSSTIFTVTFNPSATGVRTATINIANNDCDEAVYDFSIQGNGIDPEMSITGNSIVIADGDLTPSITDNTDFGNILVCPVAPTTRMFSIQNTGVSDLNLIFGGITITGPNAADFSIFSFPSLNPVTAGGASSTFFIAFDPTSSGLKSATISIPNNDCDENPYNFSIQGFGIDPEAEVKGNGTVILDEDATPSLIDHTDFGSQSVCSGTIARTFILKNIGNSMLTSTNQTITGVNAGDFTITSYTSTNPLPSDSTSFTVSFDPSASGLRTAMINVFTDDCDEAVYNFSIQGTGGDAEINLQGNATTILDGDVTPTATDHTDFGSQSVCSGIITRTFTIQNIGASNLIISTPTITGTHASDFTVTVLPTSPVAAAGSTTFQVTFNPSATGIRNATINIINNDCDENPYDFAIQGTGTDPEINLQGNTISIADGDVTPSLSDHTDFGSQSVCAGSVVRTFTIQNIGNTNLTIGAGAITLTGANAGDYSIGGISLPATIAGSSSTSFTITFNPSATGVRNATINVASNDCDETAYDFSIQGLGAETEINVLGNATIIVDGDITPGLTDHTDFGLQNICTGTINRTFTIENNGNSNLNITSVSISGAAALDYTIVSPPSTTVAAGSNTTFTVSFDPSLLGNRNATITIVNNDCDEANFYYAIVGFGVDPEINIQGNGVNIVDGDINPSLADHTDFGSVSECAGFINRTFTYENQTSYPLTLSNFTITGIHAADFSLITPPPLSMTGPVSSVFVIQFNPSAVGLRTATIDIFTNDCDEAVYNFSIQGTGLSDAVAPIAVCQNLSVSLDAMGSATILPSQIDNGSSDNCGILSTTVTPNNFSCSNVGANAVVLTVIDLSSNSSTCNATVTINDITPPAIVCQNVNAYLDTIGQVSILPSMINSGSTDACGIASSFVSPNSFACANIGNNTVTLTVTDVNGNFSTCNALVTVLDTIYPVFTNVPADIYINANDTSCNAMVFWTLPLALDNCAGLVVSSTHNPGDVFPIGTTPVGYLAYDATFNLTGATFYVIVTDSAGPIPNLSSLPLISDECSVTISTFPTATDNCSGSIIATTTDPLTYNTQGTHIITWNYSDVNGSTTTQAQTVIIDDITQPVITGVPADIVVSNSSGNCDTIVSWVTPMASDNCILQSFTSNYNPGDLFNVGVSTVTYVAMDASGNADSMSFNVTVLDVEPPVFVSCPTNMVVCEGDTVYYTLPTGSDNCSGVIINYSGLGSGSFYPVGLTTNTYILEDASGNMDTCIFTITALPSPVSSLSITEDSVCINGGILPLSGTPVGGTFSGPGVSGTNFDPSLAGLGLHLITYEYTDSNSCSSEVTESIVVLGCSGLEGIILNQPALYPNPTSDFITISFGSPSKDVCTIQLYNVVGEMIMQTITYAESILLDLSSLSSGVYILKTETSGEKPSSQRIIKK